MAKWQKTTIPISKKYSPTERKAIAQEVIEFIRDRTSKGKDKNNQSFKGYSKGYKSSLDFKLGGKSSKVNLRLTNEMMSELDLISHKNGSLLIGYDKADSDLNGKVEGNRLGTYGNKRPVTRGRDFLGIAKKDLDKILKKYPTSGEGLGKRALEILKASRASEEIVAGVVTEILDEV